MNKISKKKYKHEDEIRPFLKEHKKWSRWLGVDQESIHQNTIWHQCLDMVNNHFSYIGLNEAGFQTSKSDQPKEYFSMNKPLSDFIQQSYLTYQCLAIRRLTDTGDDIHSLTRLIDRLEKKSHLLNRKVFVQYLGYPYEYERGLKEYNDRMTKEVLNSKDGTAWSEIPKERHSRDRHKRFDVLANTNPDNRSPDDLITATYWHKLKSKLETPEIKQIRSFTNKYLAHAANEKSAASLEKEAKTLSVKKIEACHKSILEVFHTLAHDFWFKTLIIEPISANNIGYRMDKPFTTPEVKDLIYKYIEDKKDDYDALRTKSIIDPQNQ